MKITREVIREKVNSVNDLLKMAKPGYSLGIEWSGIPAKPRITLYKNYVATYDLSPRASNKEIDAWITAFKDGIILMQKEVNE